MAWLSRVPFVFSEGRLQADLKVETDVVLCISLFNNYLSETWSILH